MLFYQNMAVHVEAVQGTTDKSEVLGKRQQRKSSALWFLFSVSSSLSLSPSWGLNGHAQLPQLRDTLFWPFSFVCAPLCLFPAICPLSAPLAHISTHNTPERFLFPRVACPPSPPLCDWASFFDCWPLLVLLFRSTIVWHVSFLRRLQREHLIRGLRCAGRRNATTRW